MRTHQKNSVLTRPRAGARGAPVSGLPLRAGLTIAVVAALAACASPMSITRGATEAEVVARQGRPAAVHTLPGTPAAKRLEYVTGPLQQSKYMVDIDPSGHVTRVSQAMDWDNFRRLRAGVDTTETVRRELGEPFYVRRYAINSTQVWHYPYRESGAFDSELGVYFDANGVLLRIESGPDPRMLRDGDGYNG